MRTALRVGAGSKVAALAGLGPSIRLNRTVAATASLDAIRGRWLGPALRDWSVVVRAEVAWWCADTGFMRSPGVVEEVWDRLAEEPWVGRCCPTICGPQIGSVAAAQGDVEGVSEVCVFDVVGKPAQGRTSVKSPLAGTQVKARGPVMVMSASKGFDCCCRRCCDRGPHRGLMPQTRTRLGERASHHWVINGVIVVEIDGRSDRWEGGSCPRWSKCRPSPSGRQLQF